MCSLKHLLPNILLPLTEILPTTITPWSHSTSRCLCHSTCVKSTTLLIKQTYLAVSTEEQCDLWFSQNQHYKAYAVELKLFIQVSRVQSISPILAIKNILNNINYITYVTWERTHRSLVLSLIYFYLILNLTNLNFQGQENHSFIHWHIQQILSEHLLCSWHCTRNQSSKDE